MAPPSPGLLLNPLTFQSPLLHLIWWSLRKEDERDKLFLFRSGVAVELPPHISDRWHGAPATVLVIAQILELRLAMQALE